MGEGRIAVGPYLVEEGALAAVELFGSFPGQPMGRLLGLSLQAVAVDLLTIIVIDIPARGFDTGVRGSFGSYDHSYYPALPRDNVQLSGWVIKRNLPGNISPERNDL